MMVAELNPEQQIIVLEEMSLNAWPALQTCYRELEQLLAGTNYELIDRVTVQTIDLQARDFCMHEQVLIENRFSEQWLTGYIAANQLEAKSATVRQMLQNIKQAKFVASFKLDDRLIGFGFGAIEQGYAGFLIFM
jgi:predicted RNA-binding protein with PIN domain